MADDFYAIWLGIPPGARPPDHYTLLGIPRFCDDSDITEKAARTQFAKLDKYGIHPDPQKRDACHRLMNEVAKARVVLASPDRKASYDSQLAAKLGVKPPKAAVAVSTEPTEEAPEPEDQARDDAEAADAYLDELANAVGTTGYRPTVRRAAARTATRSPSVGPFAIVGATASFVGVLFVGYWLFLRPTPTQVAGPVQQPTAPTNPGNVPFQPVAKGTPIPGSSDGQPKLNSKLFDMSNTPGTGNATPPPTPPPVSTGNPDPENVRPAPEPEKVKPTPPPTIVAEAPKVNVPTPLVPPPPPEAPRLKVPTVAEQTKSEELVKEIFAPYPPVKQADRAALAGKMVDLALEPNNDVSGQYVLFRDSRDMAAGAGEVTTALKAADEMSKKFDVQPSGAEMKLALLEKMRPMVRSASDATTAANACMQAGSEASTGGKPDVIAHAAALADSYAHGSGDPDLIAAVKNHFAQMHDVEKTVQTAKTATEALKVNPNDPQNNLAMGKYLCFVQNDWDHGLPLLAKGADPALKSLAETDLARPSDPEKLLELANGWWDAAEKVAPAEQAHVHARAGILYAAALPGLSGLYKDLAAHRIALANASTGG
jgi:hypothetical protein